MTVWNYSTVPARSHEAICAAIEDTLRDGGRGPIADRGPFTGAESIEIEKIRVMEELRRELSVLSGVLANIRDKVVAPSKNQ